VTGHKQCLTIAIYESWHMTIYESIILKQCQTLFYCLSSDNWTLSWALKYLLQVFLTRIGTKTSQTRTRTQRDSGRTVTVKAPTIIKKWLPSWLLDLGRLESPKAYTSPSVISPQTSPSVGKPKSILPGKYHPPNLSFPRTINQGKPLAYNGSSLEGKCTVWSRPTSLSV